MAKQTGVILIIFCFCLNCILGPERVYAQASLLDLPIPGTMVNMTPAFLPTVIRGIKIDPENPFHMDFIVDRGQVKLSDEDLKKEAKKSIKYFLAALTIPEDDLWVNLSPYEKNKIIPENLGLTEMGRDMLAQDYILKQLTSSLIYPESNLGKEFWKRVYTKAYELYHTIQIPVNTFNKVWILPDRAVIFENGDKAFVVKARLKVMMEADYLSRKKNLHTTGFRADEFKTKDVEKIGDVSASIIREIILPEIEKEVNEGQNFIGLRQIYYSLILATWFKQNLRQSFLGKTYVEKNKIAGVDVKDKEVKQKIYRLYLRAFKKGVYNYIKEDYDPATQQLVPRKYFSGGTEFSKRTMDAAEEVISARSPRDKINQAMSAADDLVKKGPVLARVNLVQPKIDLGFLRSMDLKKAASGLVSYLTLSSTTTMTLSEATGFVERLKILLSKPSIDWKGISEDLKKYLSNPDILDALRYLQDSIQSNPVALTPSLPVRTPNQTPPTSRLNDRSDPRLYEALRQFYRLQEEIKTRKIKEDAISEALRPIEIAPSTPIDPNSLQELVGVIRTGENISFVNGLSFPTLASINKVLNKLLRNREDLGLNLGVRRALENTRMRGGNNAAMVAAQQSQLAPGLAPGVILGLTSVIIEGAIDPVHQRFPSSPWSEVVMGRNSLEPDGPDFISRLESVLGVGIVAPIDFLSGPWSELKEGGALLEVTKTREVQARPNLVADVLAKLIEKNPNYTADGNQIYRTEDGEKILVLSFEEASNEIFIPKNRYSAQVLDAIKLGFDSVSDVESGAMKGYHIKLRAEGASNQAMIGQTLVNAPKTKGGIDFNPNELQIEKRGMGTRFNAIDFKNPDQAMINGLTPVIVQVSPITDLPHLLGIPQNQQPVS